MAADLRGHCIYSTRVAGAPPCGISRYERAKRERSCPRNVIYSINLKASSEFVPYLGGSSSYYCNVLSVPSALKALGPESGNNGVTQVFLISAALSRWD